MENLSTGFQRRYGIERAYEKLFVEMLETYKNKKNDKSVLGLQYLINLYKGEVPDEIARIYFLYNLTE